MQTCCVVYVLDQVAIVAHVHAPQILRWMYRYIRVSGRQTEKSIDKAYCK